ncbi:MAG: ubiquinone/menaquinone biosynthesis methyltransferase [Desulfurivibrionaceae bacterium]
MQNPDEKKRFVRRKFSSISHRYDLLNSTLSFLVDHYWRWRTVRELREFPSGRVLDLCAGTLPVARELARQAPAREVVAMDFCEDMLRAGINNRKSGRKALDHRIYPVAADGEKIAAKSGSFQGVTVAFGVRNLARTLEGLKEMARVLQPGGKLLILEFSRPDNPVIKPLYNFYLNRVLPRLAGLVSGDKEAYDYLASSIGGFYEPAELMAMMKDAGFRDIRRIPLTFGIVSIYRGIR